MQIFRKNLQFRYDQLFKAEKKDDVINFEELGVDALIVDEAHAYKNNFSYTKFKDQLFPSLAFCSSMALVTSFSSVSMAASCLSLDNPISSKLE